MGNSMGCSATIENGMFHKYAELNKKGPKKEGYSHEICSVVNLAHPEQTTDANHNGCETIWEGWDQTRKRVPNANFLGTRNL